MTIDKVVVVNITKETSAPTQAGFGTALLLGANVTDGVVESYGSFTEVEAVYSSSDAEYKAAQAYFGQAVKPQTLKMAFADPNPGVFLLKQSAGAADLSVTVNGTTVSGATLSDLATALAALDDIDAATVANTNYIVVEMAEGYAEGITDPTADTGTLSYLTGNVSGWDFGTAFDTSVSLDIDGVSETSASDYQDLVDEAIANVALEVSDGVASGNRVFLVSDTAGTPNVLTNGLVNSVASGAVIDCVTTVMDDFLAAAATIDSDFYALLSTDILKQNVLNIAAWAESNKKLFVTRTADANSYSAASTTDVGYLLSSLNLDRTTWAYHGAAATEYIDAALLGRNLPEDPGSITWSYTQLSLVTADNLTSGQIDAIRAKNGNTFTAIKGVDVFMDGRVASGEWIDITRGIDWHSARMSERVFTVVLNSKKVPYTDKGVAILEAAVRAEVQVGIRQGLFSDSPAPTFTIEPVADQTVADRTNRIYPGISYTATLAGAIHKTTIAGTVAV